MIIREFREFLGLRWPSHAWAMRDDNGASVNEYLAIERDGSCTWITCGALKRVSGCILPGEVSR